MIDELDVRGIKSFVDHTPLPMRPLTVLSGTNSSGKSTILQCLLLLRNALARSSGPPALYLNGPGLSIGSYDDWSSYRRGADAYLRLTLSGPAVPSDARGGDSGNGPLPIRSRIPGWWEEPRDLRGAPLSTRSKLSLGCVFSKDATNPSVAGVQESTWTLSTLDATPGTSPELVLKVSRAPTDPLPMHATDISARVPFILDLDPLSAEVARVPQRVRCSLDGLLPETFVEDLPELAYKASVAQALEFLFIDIASPTEASTSAAADRLKFLLQTAATSPDSGVAERRTKQLLDSVAQIGDVEFRRHLRASRRAIARTMLGLAHPGRPPKPTNPTAQLLISNGYCSRILELMPTGASQSESLAAAARGRIASLADVAAWRPVLELFREYLSSREDGPVASLLDRAALEYGSREPDRRFRSLDDLIASELYPLPAPAAMKRFAERFLFHLGPLRDEPRSLYSAEPPLSAEDVGPRGERAVACLRLFGEELVSVPMPGSGPDVARLHTLPLRTAVLRWGQHLQIFDDLEVETSSYGISCKVIVRSDEGVLRADLNNVGVGVSQLLPLIVLGLAAPLGSTILVEQPELHLHPSVQTRLASFFAALSRAGRQFIVETHSEHLINGLRLLVAQQAFSPEDASLLFAERDSFGTRIREVRIANDGRIEAWPRGFFDEAERTLAEVMNARSRRGGEGAR